MHRGYTCLWRKIWSNAVLAEPGKRFSRLEAWLYITNVLSTPIDDEASGLKRGEFVASIRQLAEYFNWSRGAVLRFLEILSENSMIMRVGHQAGQEAGHFAVCNYDTYNSPRDTWRDTGRDTECAVEQEAEHLNVCDKDTYNVPRDTGRQGVCNIYNNNSSNRNKDTPASAKASAGAPAHAYSSAGAPAHAYSSAGKPTEPLVPAGEPPSATAPANERCGLARRSFSEGGKILPELYKQHNQLLPEVKVVTAERLRRCRSRINQAVRDGCLEQYLADFAAAVKKAQQTPFLRGEGARGWRASFDWFVANHVNIYAVLEGKYDQPSLKLRLASQWTVGSPAVADSSVGVPAGASVGVPAEALAKAGGNHATDRTDFDCEPGGTSSRRTSRGDPIYRPRQ
jgi:hypothetical protein